MTLEEFSALKVGDHINGINPASVGVITELKGDGVYVAWLPASIVTWFYSVNSTAWMHWSKKDG